MEIFQRIKFLRKDILHETQSEFSKRAKISRSNLGSIETGRVSVTDRVLSDIVSSTGVNKLWLETGNGSPFDEEMELDADAEAVEELLTEVDDKIYTLVKAFLRTYSKLDRPARKVLQDVAQKLADEIEKGQV